MSFFYFFYFLRFQLIFFKGLYIPTRNHNERPCVEVSVCVDFHQRVYVQYDWDDSVSVMCPCGVRDRACVV